MIRVPYFSHHTVLINRQAALRGGSFWQEGAYAPRAIERVYAYLRTFEKPVLIDVGANSGSYALLATVIPDLTVYAFEPVKESRNLLTQHVRENGVADRVHIFRQAIGETDGKATLFTVYPEASSALSMVNGTPAQHKVIKTSIVPMLTLDTVCKEERIHPTLIKIDCEGGEQKVLEGGIETFARYAPALALECNYENLYQYGTTPELVGEYIQSLGYSITVHSDGDLFAVK